MELRTIDDDRDELLQFIGATEIVGFYVAVLMSRVDSVMAEHGSVPIRTPQRVIEDFEVIIQGAPVLQAAIELQELLLEYLAAAQSLALAYDKNESTATVVQSQRRVTTAQEALWSAVSALRKRLGLPTGADRRM